MANRVDPDEMAHYELSHQDLHCLQKLFWSAGLKGLINDLDLALDKTIMQINMSEHMTNLQ